jgi:hypothetical protein
LVYDASLFTRLYKFTPNNSKKRMEVRDLRLEGMGSYKRKDKPLPGQGKLFE